ncbi:Hsp20/alpha crystallin family protein [Halosolutus halophilus]|uniref:Hsp20/alpha crystallin family protein n=1 Tax=Halosolutus halophilus TaxID=1552990 RepID=UPI002A5AB0AC|nr:Hsp20/alpha crystallin family protein [Halosolutus halophilus]
MSEWTDDSDDEPADDHREESDEADEAEETEEMADEPSDVEVADDSSETESEQNDREPNATASGDDTRDGDEPDREPHDDRPATSRDPHPHTRATNAGSDGDGDDHWLSSLIDALERLEGSSTSGQRRSDRTVLDYDVSIGTAFDSDDEVSDSPFGSNPIDESSGEDSRRGRSRKRRRRHSSSGAHHLTTRTTEDELLVTADVAGADPADVTVGFDDGTLVVAVAGWELDRVDVPWADRSADASIKNGILTVEVTPGPKSTGEEDEDG